MRLADPDLRDAYIARHRKRATWRVRVLWAKWLHVARGDHR